MFYPSVLRLSERKNFCPNTDNINEFERQAWTEKKATWFAGDKHWAGPEGDKMGTGIRLLFTGKMGFHALGLGFMSNKKTQNGHWGDGIGAPGYWDLGKNWAGKW